MLAIQLRPLVHEFIRVELDVWVMIIGLPGRLSSSQHGVHVAAGSTPLHAFGQFDAMNILEVEF